MEFISAKQFRKESKEVQEVFIKWFLKNHSDTDLIQFEAYNKPKIALYSKNYQKCDINFIDGKVLKYGEDEISCKYEITPLFTEGNLRKFIEDKKKKNIILVHNLSLPVEIWVGDCSKIYKTNTHDVIQAYWKVAVAIASEEIKNN